MAKRIFVPAEVSIFASPQRSHLSQQLQSAIGNAEITPVSYADFYFDLSSKTVLDSCWHIAYWNRLVRYSTKEKRQSALRRDEEGAVRRARRNHLLGNSRIESNLSLIGMKAC